MAESVDWATALGASVVGGVSEVDGVWVWSCDCGDKGECGGETLAALTLYFHRRSGHRQVLDVEIG